MVGVQWCVPAEAGSAAHRGEAGFDLGLLRSLARGAGAAGVAHVAQADLQGKRGKWKEQLRRD